MLTVQREHVYVWMHGFVDYRGSGDYSSSGSGNTVGKFLFSS